MPLIDLKWGPNLTEGSKNGFHLAEKGKVRKQILDMPFGRKSKLAISTALVARAARFLWSWCFE